MAHHKIGDVGDGQLGAWGFPAAAWAASRGALRDAAESFGAEVRTDAPVARIDVRDGRVTGVALESGEELARRRRRSPRRTRRSRSCDQIDRAELPDDFVDRHRALEDRAAAP